VNDAPGLIDIYTLRAIDQPSVEHILPRSLGGRLKAIGLIDKTTNDRFGSGIDAAIDRAFHSIRVILGAPSADGHLPRPLKGITAADGERFDVAPGGKVTPRTKVKVTPMDGDKIHLEATVPDVGSVRQMLRKHARRTERNLDEIVAALMEDATDRFEAMPELTFELPLDEPDLPRACAKVACNLFAHRDARLFLTSAFDPIRSYVHTGVTRMEPSVQPVLVDVTSAGLGPLDHLVRIDSTATGEATGMVVYFGLIAFVVRLGFLPPEVSPQVRSYRVDQLGSQDRVDHPDDLFIPIPSFVDANSEPAESFDTGMQAHVEKLVTTVMRIQRDRWFQGVVAPHAEVLRRIEQERTITEEDQRAFSKGVADDLMKELEPGIVEALERRRRSGRP
jgi:hypothetical protein